MIEVRWHGRGGQGAFTGARLLGLSAVLFEGRYALAFPSFGPERRGAAVLAFNRIADEPVGDRSDVTECDYVVVLDDTLLAVVWQGLKPGCTVLVNTARPEIVEDSRARNGVSQDVRVIALDASAIAKECIGRPIVNTAMLGALAAASGLIRQESAEAGIRHEMPAAQAEKNVQALRRAAEEVRR